MNKRGQATTFVIVGITILAVVILLFYLRGQFFFGPFLPRNVDDRFDALRSHIQECLAQISPDYIERIGRQGGHLSTPVDTYRLHEDTTVSYLCYDIPDTPLCSTRMLTRQDMETELSEAIEKSLATCLQLQRFRGRGVTLTTGSPDVSTEIGDDVTIVSLHLPITLQKDDRVIKEDTFSKGFTYPLGRLYEVARDVIDVESEFGEFEQLSYMLAHKGQYIIDKKKPYPDKLYILRTKDSSYIFQFFVQGEPLS